MSFLSHLISFFILFSSNLAHAQKPLNSLKRDLLITGCARSGTTFISDVLVAAGLDMPHEFMGKKGSVSWLMCIDDRNLPWRRHSRYGYQFTTILHQVRDPLKTIASIVYTEREEAFDFYSKHVSQIQPDDSKLEKAVKYWIFWNKKAESIASWRYKIEDLEDIWDEFCLRIGQEIDKQILLSIPKDANHRPSKPIQKLSWSFLKEQLNENLYNDLQLLAFNYGYQIYD
jgi:hypothetical protein